MRKTKYDTHVAPFLYEIGQMARNGATEEEIAKKLNVAYSTFRGYKDKHEELNNSLRMNKEMADLNVEAALYKRATGYEYTEVTKERIVDTGQKKRHNGESELTEKEWEFAIKYFNGRCAYCGKSMDPPTKDHLKPLNAGGALTRENVLPCCQYCNSSKKDNEWETWYKNQAFYNEGRFTKIIDYFDFINSLEDLLDEEIGQLVVTKEVTKKVAPDVSAQIFYLKNRKPETWRDKQHVEVDGLKEEQSKLTELLEQRRERRESKC